MSQWINVYETPTGIVVNTAIMHPNRESAALAALCRAMYYPTHRCVYRIKVTYKNQSGPLSIPGWEFDDEYPPPVTKQYVDSQR
jgi:hypothetical protein